MICDMYVQYNYITIVIIIIIIVIIIIIIIMFITSIIIISIIIIIIIIAINIKTNIKINVKLQIKHVLNIVLSNKSWMMKFPQTLNFNISHLLQQWLLTSQFGIYRNHCFTKTIRCSIIFKQLLCVSDSALQNFKNKLI